MRQKVAIVLAVIGVIASIVSLGSDWTVFDGVIGGGIWYLIGFGVGTPRRRGREGGVVLAGRGPHRPDDEAVPVSRRPDALPRATPVRNEYAPHRPRCPVDHEVPAGANFCPSCGIAVSGGVPEPSAETPTTDLEPPPPQPATPQRVPAGWYADPTGRFPKRYYNSDGKWEALCRDDNDREIRDAVAVPRGFGPPGSPPPLLAAQPTRPALAPGSGRNGSGWYPDPTSRFALRYLNADGRWERLCKDDAGREVFDHETDPRTLTLP